MLRTARRPSRRVLGAAASVAAVGLLVGACGGDGDATSPFGSKDDRPKASAPPGAPGIGDPPPLPTASGKSGSSPEGKAPAGGGGIKDLVTADPCSFAPRETYVPFALAAPSGSPAASGPPAKDPVQYEPGVTLNTCRVAITAKAGGIVDVDIDLASTQVDETKIGNMTGNGATLTEVDGAKILSAPPSSAAQACQRALVDKQNRLSTIAVQRRNDMAAAADVCAIADAVVTAGAKQILAGTVGTRAFAPNTFTKVKACDTVSDATLAKIIGSQQPKNANLSGAGCTAGVDKGTVILFKVGLRTTPIVWEKNAKPAQPGGRQAMLEYEQASTQYRLPNRCSATTQGPALPKTTNRVEVAEVVVLTPNGTEAQLCEQAQIVAAEMFAKLPK